jgi:hypothetical protein
VRGCRQDGQKKPESERHSLSVERRGSVIRKAKESQRTRDTHVLSSAEGGTGQDSEITPASKEDSLAVECRETRQDSEREPVSEVHSPTVERRHPSGKRKKSNERGALTFCRTQGRGLVETEGESQ